MDRVPNLSLAADRQKDNLRIMIRKIMAKTAQAKGSEPDEEAVQQVVREALKEDRPQSGGVPASQWLQAMVKEIKRAGKRARDSSSDDDDDKRPAYTNIIKESRQLAVLEVSALAEAEAMKVLQNFEDVFSPQRGQGV